MTAHARAAVVIGVDRYPDPALSDLRGAAADARAFADLLTTRFDFDPASVALLLDEAATGAAIEAALRALPGRVEAGGLAVVFFAGHGAQRPDLSGEEADGWDETLVPHDSGRGDRPDRDLTDDALRALVAPVAQRAQVVMVLDCCHSGTAARADGVRAAPPGRPAPRSRGLRAREGTGAQVLVAAAAADQKAHERPTRPGGPLRGLLTRHLIDALSRLTDRSTWRTVMARVAAAVQAVEPGQTPQLEGKGRHLRPFRTTGLPRIWAPAKADERGIHVALGRLHGVEAGARIGLYGLDDDTPLGAPPVLEAGPVACRCAPLSAAPDGPLRALPPATAADLWTLDLDDGPLGARLTLDGAERETVVVTDGAVLELAVHNDGGKRLNLALVTLDDDDRATVLMPPPGAEWVLAPFGHAREVLDAALPPRALSARHRLVLVVADRPVDLRALEAADRSVIAPDTAAARCQLLRAEVRITPGRSR